MADRLIPTNPLDAFSLPPIAPVPGLQVGLAPIKAAVGIAGTHGASGIAAALEPILGHCLDLTPGSCTGEDPVSIWTGPDRWLVTSDHRDRFPLMQAIARALPRSALATDVTDGLPAIELAGPAAPRLLAHGCPIILEDGRSARTLLALQAVTLASSGATIRIFVDRSLVPFLWHWLARHVPLVV